MKLAILTPNPFPVGNVATNRFTTYARTLSRIGCDVTVLVMKGTDDPASVVNVSRAGTWSGIQYEYMARDTTWRQSAWLLRKVVLYAVGITMAVIRLARARPDAILMYTTDPIYTVLFGVVAKLISARYLIDRSEYPRVRSKRPTSISRYLILKTFLLFDGILVMTTELRSYYASISRRDADILLLPMSVDVSRFPFALNRDGSPIPYFGCLFGVHNRDCIEDTIRAFDLYCSQSPDDPVLLRVVGDYTNLKRRHEVELTVRAASHRDRIVFEGVMNAQQVPAFLCGAIALVTTPRVYESGGFPTKLGEYLATGRPVICTEVGEIPNYLNAGSDCMFAKPGDLDGIADAMRFVRRQPEEAARVGLRGREVALTTFNADTYAEELRRFVSGDCAPARPAEGLAE